MTILYENMLGALTRPDDTGNCYWLKTPLSGENLEDFAIFFENPAGADVQLYGQFFVPIGYKVNTAKVHAIYMHDDLTPNGNLAWELKYKKASEGESYASSFLETLTVATLAGVWLTRQTTTITLAAANFAAGDDVRFTFSRDNTSDTADGKVRLRGLFFEYQDVL